MDEKSRQAMSEEDLKRHAKAKLIHRFYSEVAVGRHHGAFAVLLDGKTMKTPARRTLLTPVKAHAEALAKEWRDQGEAILPMTMPMTRLYNSILDRLAGKDAEALAVLLDIGGRDQLFNTADAPDALVRIEAETWTPVIDWAEEELGVRPVQACGFAFAEQPEEFEHALRVTLQAYPTFVLGCLQDLANLMSSLILAMTQLNAHMSLEEAWKAAHVDEDYQWSFWGVDDEAAARRAQRWAEAKAARTTMTYWLDNINETKDFEKRLNSLTLDAT